MAEVPEHLRKRAEERRAALAAKQAAESGEAAPPPAPADQAPPAGGPDAPDAAAVAASNAEAEKTGKIPAHLLARSAAARAKGEAASGGGAEGGATPTAGGVATLERPAGGAGAAVAAGTLSPPGGPAVVGPAGHTQRLLTVVKAGSIQDVKATPTDKVHTWPHLLVGEFVASLVCTAFLLIFSAFVNAPLLGLANYNQTPNPSKAPWYFLGLQELLTMFHPMVAGVTIPGMGIFILILAPYSDRNPSNKPEDRKFALALFTIFMMFWAVLVVIGSFFRGPGFNFILPWNTGIFFEF
jgi:hypothetical protein